jgi:glycosyltransferase involved in cell wall biosynthesis
LALQPAGARPPLVLSGGDWALSDPLAVQAIRLGIGHHVHFSGPLDSDDDLALLYSGAALYAQPSLSEGFGLPPLEAMACGTPVVSSNGGSLPEAVGDAALVLPPSDPASWAEAIVALLGDPERRAAMARAGVERARSFTWARTAERTRAVYARALASARSRRGTRAAASAR